MSWRFNATKFNSLVGGEMARMTSVDAAALHRLLPTVRVICESMFAPDPPTFSRKRAASAMATPKPGEIAKPGSSGGAAAPKSAPKQGKKGEGLQKVLIIGDKSVDDVFYHSRMSNATVAKISGPLSEVEDELDKHPAGEHKMVFIVLDEILGNDEFDAMLALAKVKADFVRIASMAEDLSDKAEHIKLGATDEEMRKTGKQMLTDAHEAGLKPTKRVFKKNE